MRCPVCGKKFDVLWPHMWRYRRGNRFICSYGCMRRMDKGETRMEKFTKEQKEKAVQIALEGGDPKAYLKSIGSANPDNMWYYLKAQLRKKDPETWERLAGARRSVETPEGEYAPAPIGGGKWEKMETPEAVPTVKVDGPLRIQTPEMLYNIPDSKMMQNPEMPKQMEYRVTGISTQIGDWQYFKKSGYLDWTPLDGNGTVSMNLEEWKELLKVIPDVARVLGVEL